MRARILVFVAVLAFGAVLVACGDDGSDTVSLDEWIEQVDEACVDQNDEIEEVEEPDIVNDPTSPDATEDDVAATADYFQEILDTYEGPEEAIEDAGTPDEKADEVDELTEVLADAREEFEAAIEAGRDGDVEGFQEHLDAAVDAYDEADGLAKDIGLEECGESGG